MGFTSGLTVKNLPAMQETQKTQCNPLVAKIPWRVWQPTPVFLSGESHGLRSLVGYSLKGQKESNTAKKLNTQYICYSL